MIGACKSIKIYFTVRGILNMIICLLKISHLLHIIDVFIMIILEMLIRTKTKIHTRKSHKSGSVFQIILS